MKNLQIYGKMYMRQKAKMARIHTESQTVKLLLCGRTVEGLEMEAADLQGRGSPL